jgi:hypothetical protein
MKKLFTFITILIFFLNANQTKASHVVGTDISYQCTSTPGRYKVTMKIYRDCTGIGLCPGCNTAVPNGTVAGCTTASSGYATEIRGGKPWLCRY